jgi:hypothetical protein
LTKLEAREVTMVWVLLVVLYKAPENAVDWNGPWKFGLAQTLEKTFNSETECSNEAAGIIAKLHKQMAVPMRYKCVAFEEGLPEGAPR